MPIASALFWNIPELYLAPEPEQAPIIGGVGNLDSGNSGFTAPLDPGQSTPAWFLRINTERNLDSADTAPPRSGQPTSVCPFIFWKGTDTDDSFGIESQSAPEPKPPISTCLSMTGSELDESLGITIQSVPTRDLMTRIEAAAVLMPVRQEMMPDEPSQTNLSRSLSAEYTDSTFISGAISSAVSESNLDEKL
jgi:hypothetical protein